MRWKILPAVLLWSATGPATAQQEQLPPIFRVTSTRVVVEFIVVDETGRFVDDLKLGEIEVKVDGKKQKADVLFPPGDIPQPVALAQFAKPPAATGPGTAEGAEQPDSSSALRTVILLDSRVLDASNFNHSVQAIRGFIEESLQADHMVMIAEIERDLKVRVPFTRDKDALLAAVDSLTPYRVYNPLDLDKFSGQERQYVEELQQQVVYLRAGMRLLCYSLSAMPGRKHVVLFSEGYPLNPVQQLEADSRFASGGSQSSEVRQAASRRVGRLPDPGVLSMVQDVVSTANDFGVTFYTVDARGLVGVPGWGADKSGDAYRVPGRGQRSVTSDAQDERIALDTFKRTTAGDLANVQNTLLALAAGTNGSAFFNSNDLGAVLYASTREQRHVYLTSFVPDYKTGKQEKFRRVHVECKRKGVLVRSQAGYLDTDLSQIQSARLAFAFRNPDYFKSLTPVLQVSQEGGQTQAVIGVPGEQITARPQGEKFEIEIVFVGQVQDEKGAPVSKKYDILEGYKLPLNREQLQGLASQPLLARQNLKLKPGKYTLLLAVEDRVSGTLGVGSQAFTVR